MTIFTVLAIMTLMASLGFCAATLNRVFRYNRRYHFPESKYTKLFRFISMDQVVVVYTIVVVAHLILTIWFVWTI